LLQHGKIIKEMPGSVVSGTYCIYIHIHTHSALVCVCMYRIYKHKNV